MCRSLTARVARALDILESGDGRARYEKATADLDDGAAPAGGGGLRTRLLPASALVLAAAGTLLVVRRRRARTFSSPPSVFAASREEDEQGLRRRAQNEVVRFGEELSVLEPEGAAASASLAHALDAYAAAGTVLDDADGAPDLAGVLALVAEGRDALHGAGPAPGTGPGNRRHSTAAGRLPLCFFHPLHGRATGRVRWRPLGRREGVTVAVCRKCADAVAHHRAPETLSARHEGRDVPYFEVPPERSLWSATGYGSFGDEPLTARVARGDFSRTAATG